MTDPLRPGQPMLKHRSAAFISTALIALSALPVGQAQEQPQWRALGAQAGGYRFATSLSAPKATEREAIEDMLAFCKERGSPGCTLVATFTSGCRYVMLGGEPVGPKELKPVFLVGETPDDARRKCTAEKLICTREPKGGCM